MGEIVVSDIGKVRIEPRRRLMTEVIASGVALVLACTALSVLKQEPSAAQIASVPPIVDRSTGKIVDRFGEKALTDVSESRPAQTSLALFAPGVDLGPAMTALLANADRQDSRARPIQIAAQDTPAPVVSSATSRVAATPRATPRAGVKPVQVAATAPLPPPRPEALAAEPATAPTLVAEAAPKEPSGLFGWRLPSEIVPTGQKVLKQMASLSGAVLDKLTP
jgi:hypothetical protein